MCQIQWGNAANRVKYDKIACSALSQTETGSFQLLSPVSSLFFLHPLCQVVSFINASRNIYLFIHSNVTSPNSSPIARRLQLTYWQAFLLCLICQLNCQGALCPTKTKLLPNSLFFSKKKHWKQQVNIFVDACWFVVNVITIHWEHSHEKRVWHEEAF